MNSFRARARVRARARIIEINENRISRIGFAGRIYKRVDLEAVPLLREAFGVRKSSFALS